MKNKKSDLSQLETEKEMDDDKLINDLKKDISKFIYPVVSSSSEFVSYLSGKMLGVPLILAPNLTKDDETQTT